MARISLFESCFGKSSVGRIIGYQLNLYNKIIVLYLLTAGFRPARSRSLSLEPGLDDIGSASDAGREIDGPCGAVIHTGAAFHAAIKVDNLNLAAVHSHNPVGTD